MVLLFFSHSSIVFLNCSLLTRSLNLTYGWKSPFETRTSSGHGSFLSFIYQSTYLFSIAEFLSNIGKYTLIHWETTSKHDHKSTKSTSSLDEASIWQDFHTGSRHKLKIQGSSESTTWTREPRQYEPVRRMVLDRSSRGRIWMNGFFNRLTSCGSRITSLSNWPSR